MNKLFGVLLTCLAGLCCCDQPVDQFLEIAPIALVPQPLWLVEGPGYFTFNKETRIIVESEEQENIAGIFTENFSRIGGWAPSVSQVQKPGDIRLLTADSLPQEGYHLEITPDEITIKASGGAGFFYAFQTIAQLLPPAFYEKTPLNREAWYIPEVTIHDAPAFSWRGYMLDVSRHFFDKQQVKDVLDMMAEIKMNRFHWHLTDDQGWRVEIKSYPRLTEVGAWRVDYMNRDETISDWWGRPGQKPGQKPGYGGFYTQDDIREIVAYAKARYIEIIPEIDMPGHAQATIAAYPELGCVNAATFVATGGVFKNNTYNPGKELTFEFAEKMLNEVMDLFPFDYVHVGGDECNKEQWKLDPHAQQRMKAEGFTNEAELQSYFIHRIEKIINNRGRNMIGWDEILEGGLAPNATVMSWRGQEGGIEAMEAGHPVIMTPSEYCYLDLKQGPDDQEPNLGYSRMLLSSAYRYKLIGDEFSKEQAELILGTQANLWTESITDWGKLTYMTYPRVFAVAENAWTPEALQDWDDFTDRLQGVLQKLQARQIRYATSAFNVNIHHRGIAGGIEIALDTEVNGLNYHYTLDGSEPGLASTKYQAPFQLKESVLFKARAFKDSLALGKTTTAEFPIHLGGRAQLEYHTPYLGYKDAAGERALIDYNYGSLTVSDDNWQGFGGNMEVDINFNELQIVSEVQVTSLRYTISGIYPPEDFEILGTVDGKNYFLMGTLAQAEISRIQGRNKITASIPLQAQEIKSLKVKAKAMKTIPPGHHRAGEPSKIYIDELVVL